MERKLMRQEVDEDRIGSLIEKQKDEKNEKAPRLLMRRRYSRLDTAVVDVEAGRLQKRRWRLRIRPRVRILFTTISSVLQRIKKGYVRIVLGFASRARDSKLLPSVAHKKKRGAPALGQKPKARTFNHKDLEQKYLDYIKRSVADGELAYYTMSMRTIGLV